MKCSLIILAALVGAAVSAPQNLYNPGYVVPSVTGGAYTVGSSQKGYIHAGSSLPSLRSGSVYSAHSSAFGGQQAAELEAQRLAEEQAVSQRLSIEQIAAQRAAAHQRVSAEHAQRYSFGPSVAHRTAYGQPAVHRAAGQVATQRIAADHVAAQRYAAEEAAAHGYIGQPALAQRSSLASQTAHLGAASYAPALRSGLPHANILRQSQDLSDDASAFNFGFESDNGISVQAQGSVRSYGPRPEDVVQAVTGSYSYVGDDGQTYTVNYVADENGFQPQGAHLHPVPEEIQRSIQYNLAHPEQTEVQRSIPYNLVRPQRPEILIQKK